MHDALYAIVRQYLTQCRLERGEAVAPEQPEQDECLCVSPFAGCTSDDEDETDSIIDQRKIKTA